MTRLSHAGVSLEALADPAIGSGSATAIYCNCGAEMRLHVGHALGPGPAFAWWACEQHPAHVSRSFPLPRELAETLQWLRLDVS